MKRGQNRGHVTHGDTGTRLYRIWNSMRQRVQNPKTINYSLYGGKGVKICDEWQNYEPFKKWSMLNGYNENLTLDRISSSGNYCPENCRWVTMKVQQNNRCNNHIISYAGESLTLSQWADKTGIPVKTLSRRIVDKHWPIDVALTTPIDLSKSHKKS